MTRSAVIILDDDSVVLIKRVRDGQTYYLFPGGGVEAGETLEDAAVREAEEELGLQVALERLLAVVQFDQDYQQYYFLAHITGGTLGTGTGAEMTSAAESMGGSYHPVRIALADLLTHDVRPRQLATALATQLPLHDGPPLRIEETSGRGR